MTTPLPALPPDPDRLRRGINRYFYPWALGRPEYAQLMSDVNDFMMQIDPRGAATPMRSRGCRMGGGRLLIWTKGNLRLPPFQEVRRAWKASLRNHAHLSGVGADLSDLDMQELDKDQTQVNLFRRHPEGLARLSWWGGELKAMVLLPWPLGDLPTLAWPGPEWDPLAEEDPWGLPVGQDQRGSFVMTGTPRLRRTSALFFRDDCMLGGVGMGPDTEAARASFKVLAEAAAAREANPEGLLALASRLPGLVPGGWSDSGGFARA